MIRSRKHPIAAIGLTLLCALLLLPIAFTFFYSFFPKTEMQAYLALRGRYDGSWLPILLSPKLFSLRQYYTILIEDTVYLRLFFNSLYYTVTILLGQAVFVPAMACGLSRFRFRGRELLFFTVLAMMLMPFQVTQVPNVITLRIMGLMNTSWAVVLPMWFTPFYIFLLRQFMIGIPSEMFEAGMVDGAGAIRGYFYVLLPVCRPVLGAALALSFADSWNMVEQPLVYLQNEATRPLSVMFNVLTDTRADIAFAGAALYILPTLILYFYFQEDILLGVQLSDLK
ncbi:MAG: carbohydrate ABC transporter permease [Oscillospiraceae bacterium]|jgi:multiple sugar transport system permease protein|nr:carbohydrate ABC transporter permease [Oscillospiraceae bacterium]